jgi:hypothetical protein
MEPDIGGVPANCDHLDPRRSQMSALGPVALPDRSSRHVSTLTGEMRARDPTNTSMGVVHSSQWNFMMITLTAN